MRMPYSNHPVCPSVHFCIPHDNFWRSYPIFIKLNNDTKYHDPPPEFDFQYCTSKVKGHRGQKVIFSLHFYIPYDNFWRSWPIFIKLNHST